MTGKRPSAKIFQWEIWAPIMRKAKQKPEPTFMMIAAKENERIAENAARTKDAMDRLAEMPCDVSAE